MSNICRNVLSLPVMIAVKGTHLLCNAPPHTQAEALSGCEQDPWDSKSPRTYLVKSGDGWGNQMTPPLIPQSKLLPSYPGIKASH